jgi:hypothetical protein
VMRLCRSTARSLVVLLCAAGLGLAAAAPAFAARGVTIRVTELPGRFTAGAQPETMTVVATKRNGDCIKIRWSLTVTVDGVALDQIRVDRIEEDGSFPVNTQAEGGAARITDQQLDPGTLCEDRTVTARYRVSFTDQTTTPQVRLAAEAFDTDGRLLDRTTVTREVLGGASPTPSAADPSAAAPPPADASPSAAAQPNVTNAGNRSSVVRVLPVGAAVGALMVVFGIGLLIRVRRRMRARPSGRPGRREVWYGAAARRRPPHMDNAPVTAPIGSVTTQRRVRRTLTLPPLRR